MTRKQALTAAVSLVRQADLDAGTRDEIIRKLELCIDELPFAKWTEAAIFDACDQYCLDHGRDYLIASDFQKAALPSHPTIKNRFGLSAAAFRDRYYPLPNPGQHHVYTQKTPEEYTRAFIAQYNALQPASAKAYDRARPDGYPCWSVIAQMNGERAWLPLLNKLGLTPVRTGSGERGRKAYRVISTSKTGSVETLKGLLKRK